ncbi:MAG: murein L,D-transpeptidase catalytic domain family protein [Halomonas sp.]|uniref:murein L,D-transpeptidase catalytic domain family protein n=1 Tax=Halomonas sp. TaxID=1486246 RepID=UPI003F92E532
MITSRPLHWIAIALLAATATPSSDVQANNFVARLGANSEHGSLPMASELAHLAPEANPDVLQLAMQALRCADPGAERLAVIDFSKPSNDKRLWVFDLSSRRLLFSELVSHGRGSGDAMASVFSNVPESYQSSIGLFRTGNSYTGRNGYSMRLEGLEEGVNDKAFERAIVVHGADYVSEDFIAENGRLGRSHGCPAVPSEVAAPLIDSIKDNQYLFSYYPDSNWLESSPFLSCNRQLASQ